MNIGSTSRLHIFLKPKFSYMSIMKNQFKNANLNEHAKIPSENPKNQFDTAKTQFEHAKTQKTAQVLVQVFLDRRSKKSPEFWEQVYKSAPIVNTQVTQYRP